MDAQNFYNDNCMNILPQLDAGCIDLFLTDIPYDGVNDTDKNERKGIRVLNKGDADILTFDLMAFLDEAYRITKGTIVVFCGIGQVSPIYNYFAEKQKQGRGTPRQLVWHKTNPSPMLGQYIYLSATENAVLFRKNGADFNAHCKHNVFNFPTGSSEMHPTEKNHQLLADIIQDCSNIGDLVFDACAGSGSTLYVAHRLGRKVGGVELNKEFYASAKKRLDAEQAQQNIYGLLGYNPYQE